MRTPFRPLRDWHQGYSRWSRQRATNRHPPPSHDNGPWPRELVAEFVLTTSSRVKLALGNPLRHRQVIHGQDQLKPSIFQNAIHEGPSSSRPMRVVVNIMRGEKASRRDQFAPGQKVVTRVEIIMRRINEQNS